MKASRLLLTGIGVGAALTYLLFYDSALQYEASLDGKKSLLHPKEMESVGRVS